MAPTVISDHLVQPLQLFLILSAQQPHAEMEVRARQKDVFVHLDTPAKVVKFLQLETSAKMLPARMVAFVTLLLQTELNAGACRTSMAITVKFQMLAIVALILNV